jgi:hypothetical protein
MYRTSRGGCICQAYYLALDLLYYVSILLRGLRHDTLASHPETENRNVADETTSSRLDGRISLHLLEHLISHCDILGWYPGAVE